MTQSTLPPGLTPDMMAAIAGYFAEQQTLAKQYVRPKGILQPNQIRGVNPNYQYRFQEFPKAITPPPVVVNNEGEERTFRTRDGQPLPWEKPEMAVEYYKLRQYPVRMQPAQIVVHTAADENARRAEWNLQAPDQVSYPRWLFSATEPPRMVYSIGEEDALGNSWYPTVKEAIEAATRMVAGDTMRNERQALIDKATQLNVQFNPAWGNKRISDAIDASEAKTKAA